MERDQILQRVRQILVTGLRLEIDPAEIVEDAPIFGEGLGLDSIDALELVVLIEEEFSIAVPDEEAARQACASIGALADFIVAARSS